MGGGDAEDRGNEDQGADSVGEQVADNKKEREHNNTIQQHQSLKGQLTKH